MVHGVRGVYRRGLKLRVNVTKSCCEDISSSTSSTSKYLLWHSYGINFFAAKIITMVHFPLSESVEPEEYVYLACRPVATSADNI